MHRFLNRLQAARDRGLIIMQEEGWLRAVLSLVGYASVVPGLGALRRYGWQGISAKWDAAFGARLVFDGASVLQSEDVGIDHALQRHAVRYEPTTLLEFRLAMRLLDIDFPAYSFVDIGSGSGRLLLMAGAYPFAAIRGIEAGRHLHAEAERNVAEYPRRHLRCADIRAELGNAAAWQPDHAPFVAFMFNPFDAEILLPVLNNLRTAARDAERPSYLLYLNPRCRELVEAQDGYVLSKQALGGYLLCYEISGREVLRDPVVTGYPRPRENRTVSGRHA